MKNESIYSLLLDFENLLYKFQERFEDEPDQVKILQDLIARSLSQILSMPAEAHTMMPKAIDREKELVDKATALLSQVKTKLKPTPLSPDRPRPSYKVSEEKLERVLRVLENDPYATHTKSSIVTATAYGLRTVEAALLLLEFDGKIKVKRTPGVGRKAQYTATRPLRNGFVKYGQGRDTTNGVNKLPEI